MDASSMKGTIQVTLVTHFIMEISKPSDTQDFGESCTTHGIKYIVERDQPFLHRLLWLAVVIAGVSR